MTTREHMMNLVVSSEHIRCFAASRSPRTSWCYLGSRCDMSASASQGGVSNSGVSGVETLCQVYDLCNTASNAHQMYFNI